jgi:hypothetical protein
MIFRPRMLLRCGALLAIALGFVAAVQAANSRSRSSDRDAPSSGGRTRPETNKDSKYDRATLERYDTNRNGKLDPDEVAAMRADQQKQRGKTPEQRKKS